MHPITGGSAETNRIVIAYPEKEIHSIRHTGVFCVDKVGFLRPSHICNIIFCNAILPAKQTLGSWKAVMINISYVLIQVYYKR